MSSLRIDRRAELGDSPGMHALLIGIGEYPHLEGGTEPRGHTFGLGQLTETATTTARLAQWLEGAEGLTPPLKTLRLLKSPADGGDGDEDLASQANVFSALVEWQEDCSASDTDAALFYFSGHGLQRTPSDPLLLLREFGSGPGNPLLGTISLRSLHTALAPTASRPDVARTQLWLADTCRDAPAEILAQQNGGSLEPLVVEASTRDDRTAPILSAATRGAQAFSAPGEFSIFGEAVKRCLEGAGARPAAANRPEWIVTVGSFLESVPRVAARLAHERGAVQEVSPEGQAPRLDTPLRSMPDAPEAEVTLKIEPAGAAVSVVAINLDSQTPILLPDPLAPNPYSGRWKSGIYSIGLDSGGGSGAGATNHAVMPPHFDWTGTVA